jgi:polygalacturonase
MKKFLFLAFSFIPILLSSSPKEKVYLFSFFEGNGVDGLHMAYSRDGYTFNALNDDKAFLAPVVGTSKLMRDPCIIRTDDGTFHMVWTAGWTEKGIGYASSKDLIHWSEQKYIMVMEKEPSAKNTWAPEIQYDKKNQQFLIFWATTIPGRFPDTQREGDTGYDHRIYYVTTKDFVTFSDTKLFYDKGFNVIDATINATGKNYVMFLKNETRTPPQKNIRVSTASSLYGPWSDPSDPITGKYWAEGPTSIRINNTWFVYFDKYVDKKYGAVISKDLKTWEDISDKVSFPKDARHGTVFEADESILAGLMQYSADRQSRDEEKKEAMKSAVFFNVRAFGAKGDSTAIETDAINRAIDAATAAGGGTVYFPAGNYLSFSIHLKSNITLFLDNGARLIGAESEKGLGGYDAPEPNVSDMYQDFGHSHWHNSLIWGENLENIAIMGHGWIIGNGLTRAGRPTPGLGNKAIALKLCRNVILKDFTVLRGGHFCLLATGVDNLTIDNVKLDTNRDGFDIDCCRYVHMSNCSVNSPFDDAIVLKSSYALGFARMTENVTITGCSVFGFDIGTFLDGTYQRKNYDRVPDRGVVTGRIKFGTESNGGFRNIVISNCTFEFCRGLALETVDGALLEDISISNITMRDVMGAPFFLRLGARMRGPEGIPVGKLRRVSISNVVVYSANPDYASLFLGLPGFDIEDIKFNNISLLIKGGAPKDQAEAVVPEKEKAYPDPQEFGKIPTYGFFIRHARNIEMSNIEIKLENEDLRPSFILEDVKGASFINVKAPHAQGVPTFVLKNVTDFKTVQCGSVPDKKIEKADSLKL